MMVGFRRTHVNPIVSEAVNTYASTTLHSTLFKDNRFVFSKLQNVGYALTLHSPYICPTLNRR